MMRGIGAATVALVATLAFQSSAEAQVTFASASGIDVDVTYSADVAPIIQKNCTVCHRPGGIGPIDLVDYDDAKRYARRIRRQVSNRLMPPYYYDNDIGIQDLKHDWRLSDEDINTIVEWVDQGAQMGDPDLIPELDLIDTEDWSFAPTLGQPWSDMWTPQMGGVLHLGLSLMPKGALCLQSVFSEVNNSNSMSEAMKSSSSTWKALSLPDTQFAGINLLRPRAFARFIM